MEHDIDTCALTETWLSKFDAPVVQQLQPDGYKLLHVDRTDRSGGGVAVLCRCSNHPVLSPEAKFTSFQPINIKLKIHQTFTNLVVIYRPPPLVPASVFLNEFSGYLGEIIASPGKSLVVGDFNFHVDDLEKQSAASFIDILNTFKLKQHVTFPMHVKGHTLDLVITLDNDDAVSRIRKGDHLSDHVSVLCDILCYKPPPTTKDVKYRCIRKIDIDQFKQDIRCLDLGCPGNSTEELVGKYNHSLRQRLDKHAPLRSRTVIV